MKENLENIRNKIKLDNNFWKHIFSTNCYAYALGLDIRERDIQPHYINLELWVVIYLQFIDQSN